MISASPWSSRRIEVLVHARLKPITPGKQVIHFKSAAPSRLYWPGRPARETAPSMMPHETCRNLDFDQSLNINSGQ